LRKAFEFTIFSKFFPKEFVLTCEREKKNFSTQLILVSINYSLGMFSWSSAKIKHKPGAPASWGAVDIFFRFPSLTRSRLSWRRAGRS